MSVNAQPKQDLRVLRTQKSLVVALFTLLEKQSFSKITVNDICELAMVSRATFYAHFEDKYHLLRFGLEGIRDSIAPEVAADRRTLITKTIERVADKPQLFRNLFLEDSNEELRRMLSSLFVGHLTKELEGMQARGAELLIPPEMMAVFLSGGMAHLMLWWINGEFSLTKEEMVENLMVMSSLSPDSYAAH